MLCSSIWLLICGAWTYPMIPVFNKCDQRAILEHHMQFDKSVSQLEDLHFAYTSPRHFEVVELLSIFQVRQMCDSVLSFFEAIRLHTCFLLCPMVCFRGHVDLPDLDDFLLRFVSDLRYVMNLSDKDPAQGIAQSAIRSFTEVTESMKRATTEMIVSREVPADTNRVKAIFEFFADHVLQILAPVLDDMTSQYHVPNFLSQELIPWIRVRTYPNVSATAIDTTSSPWILNPRLLPLLSSETRMGVLGGLIQPSFRADYAICGAISPLAPSVLLAGEFSDLEHWKGPGNVRRRNASPFQILRALNVQLSNLFVSFTFHDTYVGRSCTGANYDPSVCLQEQLWGGYYLEVNPFGEVNLTVSYAGKPLGPTTPLSSNSVHTIYTSTLSQLLVSTQSLFKSINHHSPDLIFLHPLVSNCEFFTKLFLGAVKAKILVVPINPLIPPPFEVVPDHMQWWLDTEAEMERLWEDRATSGNPFVDLAIAWRAQCSLEATVNSLPGYRLFQVDHTYAVFVLRKFTLPPRPHLAMPDFMRDPACAAKAYTQDNLYLWLHGYYCTPQARGGAEAFKTLELSHFQLLGPPCGMTEKMVCDVIGSEVPLSPISPVQCGDKASTTVALTTSPPSAKSSAALIIREVPLLRFFIGDRGRCVDDECECFVPYRGMYCDIVDPPRVNHSGVKAVIHYVTPEVEQDLVDLEFSLDTLWRNYNHRFDHPVIIFHEGLSFAARDRILRASDNRIWFSNLGRHFATTRDIPAAIRDQMPHEAPAFSLGYRAMIRWRSGPMFLEPILAPFDYAMTLDTDSYFPGDVVRDPFDEMRDKNLTAAFPHLGRESASVVVNFLHYFLLYCKLKDLNPRRTKVLASLVEVNWKWYQQCFMMDIEIVRLDWFRSDPYQEFFRFMDATGGFWLYRWGNNPFRTFAIGVLLDDNDVSQFPVPYAHQDFCYCTRGTKCETVAHAVVPGSSVYTCVEELDKDEREETEMSLEDKLLRIQPYRGAAWQSHSEEVAGFFHDTPQASAAPT